MASAITAAATGTDLSTASAHARHALAKTGMSHVVVRYISDTADWRRDGVRRRKIRDKLSSPSPARSPARKIEKGSGAGSGSASIYSGRQTASGEVMDPGKMTAAHPSLPFGTEVTVTNHNNGRSVVVRINDRGPFVRGRVIDLSPAAGRALGVNGLAHVSLAVGGGHNNEPRQNPDRAPQRELVAEER
jgi:rare lipoprotein A